MPTSFLSLPAELRNEIYMYLLVCREPIDPWNGYNGLVPNILSTNTKIIHEVRSLLYGENYFDFSGRRSLLISQFLDNIGFVNAFHILCIRIDFPRILGPNDKPAFLAVYYVEPSRFRIEVRDEVMRILP